MRYSVYVLKCNDGSFYTGSTTHLQRRILEHNTSKKGAKYTRGRRPVALVYFEEVESCADARTREAEIKHMRREQKIKLIEGHHLCSGT